MTDFASILITIVAFLVSITFHEFCHALMAYALGDDTAKRAGRLTLNPLSHIDPLGLLFIVLVRIGWAKPVPFDARNFKYPRFYSILVGLAGPAANFLLALICLYLLHYIPWGLLGHYAAKIVYEFLKTSVWINVMLGVFNLIPIPPLDGSHIISAFIPESLKPLYYRFQQFSFIILIILLNIPMFQRALFAAITFMVKFLTSLVF